MALIFFTSHIMSKKQPYADVLQHLKWQQAIVFGQLMPIPKIRQDEVHY